MKRKTFDVDDVGDCRGADSTVQAQLSASRLSYLPVIPSLVKLILLKSIEMPTSSSHWKRATFVCDISMSADEVEGLALELVESVGGYTEIQPQNRFLYFWDSRSSSREQLENACTALGLVPREILDVPDENWTQKCEELLEAVHAGDVVIQPYAEAPYESRLNPKELAIIPGQGFGTGHHDTTRTIVEELVDLRNESRPFRRALDIGTGSGILAIAAAKMFGTLVDAMDNDPDAIGNARDNVAMNGCGDKISLSTLPLSAFKGPYDLILANIYAEVLVSFTRDFDRLSQLGSILVVSGVTIDKKLMVQTAILESKVWTLRRWKETSSWCSGCFERM